MSKTYWAVQVTYGSLQVLATDEGSACPLLYADPRHPLLLQLLNVRQKTQPQADPTIVSVNLTIVPTT